MLKICIGRVNADQARGVYRAGASPSNYAALSTNPMQVKFSPTGAAYKGNNLSTWETTSDAAVKQEVTPIAGALDTLMQVRPVTFRYTDEYRAVHPGLGDGRHYSVIAQEFAEVFPDAVSTSGERLAGENRALYQVNIHPALITAMAAIQELNVKLEAENEAQKAKLADQNNELAELRSQVQALSASQQRLEALIKAL